MKKLFNICLLLLCQLTVFAQGDETKYTLTVQTDPKGTYVEFMWKRLGYYDNKTSTELKIEVAAGQQVDFCIKRYSYANYKPAYLMSEGTRLPIEQTSFEATPDAAVAAFIMPDHDATITVVMEYDPELPPNPNQSGWDEPSGSLIVNDFVPGELQYAIRDAIAPDSYNADYTKVKSLMVAGTMAMNDWNFIFYNYLTEMTIFDISRTTGLEELDYGYSSRDNEKLTTLLLPATVKSIGHGFNSFKALRSLTCYATTPPELTYDALKNLPAEAEVFVPAESLPLYAEAEGWKDLNLMPISQGVHKMTVNLPANAEMKQLKDMSLELVNVKTGQTRRYVLANRTQYTFTNLIENTLYNVYIRNAREDILATIEAVAIEKQDVQVTFPALKPLRDITLRLTAPDGSAAEADAFTVTWTDPVGNYIAKGATLPAQVEGSKAIAKVKLAEALGTQYQQPADTLITVGEMGNMGEMGIVGIRLTPLQQAELTGTVTAAATGLPIRGATVSVTQQLNGLYPVTQTATTDKDGQWTLTAYAAPTEITARASGYIPQTRPLSALAAFAGEPQDFSLADLTGTTVNLDLSYRPAVRSGEQSTADTDFNGWADIAYTVYDETHQQDIADITLDNARIVLNGLDLAEGTRLRVTAKSLTGIFGDVTATCTVNVDGEAIATLPLTEYGSLIATFNETENLSVTGMLFKTSGELVARGFYQTTDSDDKPTLTFNCVPDGNYLLITMGESRLYNSFATLGALLESGLKSKVDYVGDNIEIASGRIDSVNNQSVPTFDETVYYATGPNTRFSVNKSQVTVGNYVTLRAQVDFKQGITPSDVQLLVDLPDGCQLVEGSVMAGNQLSTYEVDGNRVIVPLANISDQIRFCVVPTAEGYYEPTASINFNNGSTVMQPIGSASITAEALRIDVPEQSPKGKVPVSGVAPASSQVQVYDGNVLIGQTKANPNGTWSLICMLNNPYNLSQHTVYAVVTNTDGIAMQTETHNVTVSYGTLVPIVHGTFFNKYHSKSEDIKWDFRDNSVNEISYGWPTNDDNVPWSFTIDFKDGEHTVNDTTVISNVVLYVLCSDDTYIAFDAKYSTRSKRWVVQHGFNHDASPKNVCVMFHQDETVMVDRQQQDDRMENVEQAVAAMQQRAKDIYAMAEQPLAVSNKHVFDELRQLLSIDNPDEATQNRIDSLLTELVGDQPASNTPVDAATLKASIKTIGDERYQWRDEILGLLATVSIVDTTALQKPTGDMDFVNEGMHYTTKKLANIDKQALLSQGYTEMPMTDGTSIFFLMTDSTNSFVDTRNATQYTIEREDKTAEARQRIVEPTVKPIFDQEVKQQFIDVFKIRGEVDQWQEPFEQRHTGVGEWAVPELKDGNGWKEEAFTQRVRYDEIALLNKIKDLCNKLYQSGLENIKQQVEESYKYYNDNYNDMVAEARKTRANAEQHLRDCYASRKDVTEALDMLEQAKQYEENVENFRKEMDNAKRTIDDVTGRAPSSLPMTAFINGKGGWLDNNLYELSGTPIGFVLRFYRFFFDINEGVTSIHNWWRCWNFWKSRNPCEGDQAHYEAIGPKIINGGVEQGLYIMKQVDIAGYEMAYTDFVPHNQGVTPQWFVTVGAYLLREDMINANTCENNSKIDVINNEIAGLDCDKKKPEEEAPTHLRFADFHLVFGKPKVEDYSIPVPEWAKPMETQSIYDPSGFVYETVESNRLEGVTATCYYKEMKEDKYGDLYENVVVWDAENYAQENPLFTDAEGKYAWDVPTGLWQVKFEKEGYETAYSDWLPVPPPQLDVNVGMTQLRQPAVSRVKACTDGIDITFDKYMDPQTLTTENIFVTKNGQTVPGTITLLNAESAPGGSPAGTYASQLRFNANFSTNDKLQLTIKKTVESYAGLQMEQDFTQQFDVEQRITAIEVDSIVNLSEDGEYTITVRILPAEAAKGKTITATALTDDVVAITPNGNGAFALTALSLGQSAVRFSLTDDADITATTLVTVRDAALMYVYAPKSSRLSGTEVYRGAEIRLTCATAGATILYTLDGSCPCDAQNAAVQTYTGPITATGTELTIRAMAVANGMAESDVAEFRYKVVDNPVAIEAPTASSGSPAGVPAYYRLDGSRTSMPQKGLNIVRQTDGTVKKIIVK